MAIAELVGFIGVVILSIAVVLSSIPLYLALRVLGNKVRFLWVVAVNVIAAVGIAVFRFFLGELIGLNFVLVAVGAFISMLLFYKLLFDITWWHAFMAWVLQIVITIVLILLLALGLGAGAILLL